MSIPYGRHEIDDDDIDAVTRILKSDCLTCGPSVTDFETALSKITQADYAVACSSGTASLHLAYWSLGFDPGDVVILPAITFLAGANVAICLGMRVLFADVHPETGLMGPDNLDDALSRVPAGMHARLVIPVHLNGQCCDMPELAYLARQAQLRIVEDACHALGTISKTGDPVGSCTLSDAAVFSFHPVKTIAMGEGGAVTSNNEKLADHIRRLRQHGIIRLNSGQESDIDLITEGAPYPWFHDMSEPGLNYRASDLHCALGLSQLTKMERFVTQRYALITYYRQRLAAATSLASIVPEVPSCRTAWHLCSALIDFDKASISRSQLMKNLSAQGISSQVHYIPVAWQPYYRQHALSPCELPGARAYYRRQLSLPLFPSLKKQQIDSIVTILTENLAQQPA